MSNTHRFIIHQDYPCPKCDGYGSIYRTVRFDDNGKSHTVGTDFECMDCDAKYEIVREGQELFLIRSESVEN